MFALSVGVKNVDKYDPQIPNIRRTTRRRQRSATEENGGASLPRAKRLRSALKTDTFVRPPEATPEPTPEPLHDVTATMNGSASRGSRMMSPEATSLPVRASRKPSDRAYKSDGLQILTRNNQYGVGKLPALPDRIRNNPNERIRASFFPDIGFALAMTATEALVWHYTSTTSSPETFAFVLPHPARNVSDPLPLGSLVAASASTAEPGLLIIMPLTGKVTYWESIHNSATLNLMRQRQGVDGSIGSLMSGETVVHIENAEPAGMILSLSSGRVALLSVRDGQGRPSLTTQFMKTSLTGTGGGILGSIRHAFGGGWRRDVASIKAGPSKKGERTIAVATTRGVMQIWEVHRGGHYALQVEANFRDAILEAVSGPLDALDGSEESFEVLDVAFASERSHSQSLTAPDHGVVTKLLVLVARKNAVLSPYSLVEVSLPNNDVAPRVVHSITSYAKPSPDHFVDRPRLYFPPPYHTAFVAFDDAVVLVNIAEKDESPEQQLLGGIDAPKPFEEVVDFRQGSGFAIVGSGPEDARDPDHVAGIDAFAQRRRGKDPSCILLVQNAGVLRVTAFEPPKDLREIEASGVKSKIEQAIQYGAESQNPLNFQVAAKGRYDLEEIEAAALEVSRDILSSESKAVSFLAPSMDSSLKQRAAALKSLATYLHQTFPPLSRAVKWHLLWDAEKLTAANAVWRLYDLRLRSPDYDNKAMDVLEQIIKGMDDGDYEGTKRSKVKKDPVRHWFARNVRDVPRLLIRAWRSIEALQKSKTNIDVSAMARLIFEGNEVQVAALNTAYKFRRQNLELYSLSTETLSKSGYLKQGFRGLPEIWTSEPELATAVRCLTTFAQQFVITHGSSIPDAEEESVDSRAIGRIRDYSPASVDVCSMSWSELQRSGLEVPASVDKATRELMEREAKTIQQASLLEQHQHLIGLGDIGQGSAAIALAEKYEDMAALVALINQEYSRLLVKRERLRSEKDSAAFRHVQAQVEKLEARMHQNFVTFGQRWADAFFDEHVSGGELKELMIWGNEYGQFLLKFLNGNPAYAKLSWICNVLLKEDYDRAGQSLLNHAYAKENDLWSKKVETSMGKLASIASQGANEEGAMAEATRIAWVNHELELIRIQDQLYDHVAPVTANRLDKEAGVSIAMKEFGKGLKGKPALRSILEQSMGELLSGKSLGVRRLVDTLTLIDPHFDAENEGDLGGQEFYLALQANQYAEDDGNSDVEIREKIIWRRCILRDDWTAINNTHLKDDQAMERAVAKTALYTTLKACYGADPAGNESPFNPGLPSDIVGAGCFPEDLRLHLPKDLRHIVAEDMTKEDVKLKQHIEKAQLDAWMGGIIEAVKKSLAMERFQQGVEKTRLAEMERTMEKSLTLTNGHLDNDHDGDVDMA